MPLSIYPMTQNTIKTKIENFKKVDDTLYRGALPAPEDIFELKRQGFDAIISLRSGFDKSGLVEKDFVEKAGLEYANFPINSQKGPSQEVTNDFLAYMEKARNANKKVFLHCKHGKDRTGTMTAIYELNFKIKTFHQAIIELFTLVYNHEKHPQMLEFIKNFAKNLKR